MKIENCKTGDKIKIDNIEYVVLGMKKKIKSADHYLVMNTSLKQILNIEKGTEVEKC